MPILHEAFSGIRELVQAVVVDTRASGETPPTPLAERAYSGRFVVRVPPDTRQQLAVSAAASGVSRNRLVRSLLAD